MTASLEGSVVSLNVGVLEEIAWRDRVFRTASRKRPVGGRRRVGPLGVDGVIAGVVDCGDVLVDQCLEMRL